MKVKTKIFLRKKKSEISKKVNKNNISLHLTSETWTNQPANTEKIKVNFTKRM